MDIKNLFEKAVADNASDIFIIAGRPLSYSNGVNINGYGEKLSPKDTKLIIEKIYELTNRPMYEFIRTHDDDFSLSIPGLSRFRVNAFMQRGSYSAVLRVVMFDFPDHTELNIPQEIIDVSNFTKGMVLVTGPAGSGKSTTLTCLVDKINKTRASHIITLEDPIEFLHSHDKSIVSQREIHIDTNSYKDGLRAALREAPNVILLGEMRDHETTSIAIRAAETGQLIFSTLHTLGAANSIDRIIDVFPPSQQQQIRIQLSMVLQAVISQQLIPTLDGKLIPVFEIMFCNNAIRSMIRDSKIHQINTYIKSSSNEGMISMDRSLFNLYKENIISKENALIYALNPTDMKNKLG